MGQPALAGVSAETDHIPSAMAFLGKFPTQLIQHTTIFNRIGITRICDLEILDIAKVILAVSLQITGRYSSLSRVVESTLPNITNYSSCFAQVARAKQLL